MLIAVYKTDNKTEITDNKKCINFEFKDIYKMIKRGRDLIYFTALHFTILGKIL